MANEYDNAAWRLFKVAYRVGIEERFFYDPNKIAMYGRYTSGDKTVDRQLMYHVKHVMLTMNVILDFFSKGASIQFVNSSDIVMIYRDITEHLEDWNTALANDIHDSLVAPIDDLILFDQFRERLYPCIVLKEGSGLQPIKIQGFKRSFSRRSTAYEEPAPLPSDETFSPTGSHLFGMQDNVIFEAKTFNNREDEVAYLRDKIKDIPKEKRSFTSIFEKYQARQTLKEKSL